MLGGLRGGRPWSAGTKEPVPNKQKPYTISVPIVKWLWKWFCPGMLHGDSPGAGEKKLISVGFWPGDGEVIKDAAFYAHAAPGQVARDTMRLSPAAREEEQP